MTTVSIPDTGRRRALIIVDLQAGFLKAAPRQVVPRVVSLISQAPYGLYIAAAFHAEKGSLWDLQTDWTFDREPVVPEIAAALQGKEPVMVTKTTKSVFGAEGIDLNALLRDRGIEEVHIVGVDTNDCVLATAFDAFDLGFFAYVIEECAGASNGEDLHEAAIRIMRNADLTNHSGLIASKRDISVAS